jgi:gas vesicle protein
VVVPRENGAPLNAAKLKEEANQLSKLAQSIPSDVDKAAKGQLAQDLAARLKQIEKLSKQLRREISP